MSLGKEQERLPPEKEGVAKARPSLFKAAAFLPGVTLVCQGDQLATATVCKALMLPHFLVRGSLQVYTPTPQDQRG